MKKQMRIAKYIPQGLYGFAEDSEGQVFFHLGVFRPNDPSNPIPPILGEPVLVETDPDSTPVQNNPFQGKHTKAPRAKRVDRVQTPNLITGVVESFDSQRGFGYVLGSDGVLYHLHRSEVLDGALPLPDQEIEFYAGIRQDRPRACYVKVRKYA